MYSVEVEVLRVSCTCEEANLQLCVQITHCTCKYNVYIHVYIRLFTETDDNIEGKSCRERGRELDGKEGESHST